MELKYLQYHLLELNKVVTNAAFLTFHCFESFIAFSFYPTFYFSVRCIYQEMLRIVCLLENERVKIEPVF